MEKVDTQLKALRLLSALFAWMKNTLCQALFFSVHIVIAWSSNSKFYICFGNGKNAYFVVFRCSMANASSSQRPYSTEMSSPFVLSANHQRLLGRP